MLTRDQKFDLRVVLRDYEAALQDGDNDAIMRTAETLDATASTMSHDAEQDQDNLALWPVISQSLDERSPVEAIDWVRAALLIVGTL